MNSCAGLRAAIAVPWLVASVVGQVWVDQAVYPLTPLSGSPAVACDEQRGRLVLVDARGDTWEHDGSRWFCRDVIARPEVWRWPRRLLAYESARRVSVLMLVPDASPAPATVFEWDGATWNQVAPAPAAAPMTALAHDPGRGRLVGFADGVVLERDSASLQWQSQAVIVPGAPARSASYDPVLGVVLMWNGLQLFAWDGIALTPLAAGPLGGFCAFDPLRQVAVVAAAGGGSNQTWEWNGATFTQRPVPALQRPTATMAFHSAMGAIVMFGGTAILQLDPPSGDAWSLGAGGWTPLLPSRVSPKPASATYGTAPVHDTARNRVVLVQPVPGNGQTWEFDGSSWLQRPGAPGRMLAALAYDAARARTILFGGAYAHGPMSPTWSYDGIAWTPVSTATTPPARHNPGMVYDSARQRVLMYGGTAGGLNLLFDTWTFDGTDWQLRSQTGPRIWPTNAPSWLLADDVARSQIAMLGLDVLPAGGGPEVWQDWVWNGSTWSQRPGPTPATFAIASEPVSGDLVTLANENSGNTMRRWNGVAWSSQPIGLPTPPGFLWFDPVAQRLRGCRGSGQGVSGDSGTYVFTSTPSTIAARGVGCGSPPPRLLARTLPAVGADGFGYDIFDGGPGAAVFLLLALTSADVPLPPAVPQPPGCRVYVGSPAATQLLLTDAFGFATANVPVPPAPALRGLDVFAQALGIDAALQIVLSAARDVRVGD